MTTNSVGTAHAEGHGTIHIGDNHNYRSDWRLSVPTAHDAAFDPFAEQHNARCHPDTRTELLCQIRECAHNPHGEIIFWLNGMAGTGKSTISRTVATMFADNGLLGASFFFKRGEGDRGKAALFFPTIASQLIRKIPALEPYVREAIDADGAIATKSLRDQLEKLILQPLDRIGQAMVILVVVDALDECDGNNDVKTIISLLAQANVLCPARLKVFITSRPELPIRLGFKNVQGRYENLALHQIPEPIVERDISAFLRYELARIRNEYNSEALKGLELLSDWPGEPVIQTLAQMAVPLFIFAATVCRFVGDPVWSDPADQLEKVLQYQTNTHGSELDKLDTTYLPVLSQLTVGGTDLQKAAYWLSFGIPIILLAQPLSVSSLARLLNISPRGVSRRLNSLHSVLSIPSKADSPVRPFHLSFRDFLVDPTKRAAEFWIDEIKYHKTLTNRCIQLMSQHLRRDICSLQMPGKRRSEVDQQTIDAALPPEIQYACRYWVYHWKESERLIRDGDLVDQFLKRHLLHWLEVMGLLGWVSESISMVNDLLGLLDVQGSDKVSAFLLDTRRVIRSHCSIIDMSPLQVYHSAIVFTPEQSVVRSTFQHQFPAWLALPPGVDLDWDACIQTLEGHSNWVSTVAFSHDSKTLASGEDNTWITWDSHNFLWLPPTYRPGYSDITASIVAIGYPSGRVLLLAFSFSHDLLT
ncbi:NWD2 protein [Staphylotrichum tortipilum]|uniref:NWD2 protein n=1 Tax=Staphylotrichum tortipilum TaxID=2831512 RepID=A0AAN6MRS8_9PEZI|nr:NWD2 protein [Staphylotrichum longicolle]